MLLLAVATAFLPSRVSAQVPVDRDSINNRDSLRSTEPQGIIYDSGEEADSVLPYYVFSFERIIRDVKILSLKNPSLKPDGVATLNAVNRVYDNYYLDQGALGQVHLSVFPFADNTRCLLSSDSHLEPLIFDLQPDANIVYNKWIHEKSYFQTLRPYTLLGYGSSINKDYQISIIHTQNIKPRWNAAFMYDLVSRDGLYSNSDVTNHVLDVTTNYYSEDSRYQVQAGISLHTMRHEENGGVDNDTTCWNENKRPGVPVKMYSAANQWRNLDIYVHQSYNTVRQFSYLKPIVKQCVDTIAEWTGLARADHATDSTSGLVTEYGYTIQKRDTIIGYDTIFPHAPRTFNTGVFGLDLQYTRQRRNFYDSQASSWFYNAGTLDTSYYFDSTTHHRMSADMYWTNDAYMQHRWDNPLIIKFGIRPEYDIIQYAHSQRHFMSFNPFAMASIKIASVRLSVTGEEVIGKERNGDYRINGNISLNAGLRSTFSIALLSEAQSPDYIFYHNEGCYQWDISNFNKIKRQQIAIRYQLRENDSIESHLVNLETRSSAMLLSDNVWINSSMTPTQGNESGLLLQSTLSSHLQFGWLHICLQEIFQYSSNDAVVRVPLFASRNSFYSDLKVFKGALHLQTGFDIRYHTRYKADAWNPVMGAFYRQDNVSVGNYIVADFWVSMQIKRASIYLRVNHFNAPLEQNPHYFSLPHYPMEDLGVYWGVIWKFFN